MGLNRPHTLEEKEHLRQLMKGRKITWCDKLSKAGIGHKSTMTDEGRRKISETLGRKIASGEIKPHPSYRNTLAGFRFDLGHAVRSSWEANICRLLKHFNIKYEYESKRCVFKLSSSVYICDLYLPELNLFIEIRPSVFVNKNNKLIEMSQLYPDVKLKIIQTREYRWLTRRYKNILTLERV